MDWQYSISRLQERLPELERQVLKFGIFFPLSLLPKGLFRDVSSGADCVKEIAQDLHAITCETPDCVMEYWSTRLSQKIHVLVHICRTHQPKQHVNNKLDKMGTRVQWLEQTQIKLSQLSQQRTALAATLERMRLSHDEKSIQALQKDLQDLDAQMMHLRTQG
ncbi:MAG: hypothetical protein NTU48_02280 [Legionellales bacterium]|jgi:hypothetical protein|nr:hypothetical protein [Legionellales bacterium]